MVIVLLLIGDARLQDVERFDDGSLDRVWSSMDQAITQGFRDYTPSTLSALKRSHTGPSKGSKSI